MYSLRFKLLDLQTRQKEIELDMERLHRLTLSDAVYRREFDIYLRKLQNIKDQIEEYINRGGSFHGKR